MIFPKNDEFKAFMAQEGYTGTYNDGLTQHLRLTQGKTHSSLPDLLANWDGTLTSVPATFSQDFSTETLESEWTFTRSGTASRYNSSGVLVSEPTDTLRYDYNPATNAFVGALIEKASTNIFPDSENFTAGSWSTTKATITPNVTTAPDNATTGNSLVEDGTSGTHQVFYLDIVPAATSDTHYVFSIYAKALGVGSTRYLQIVLAGTAYISIYSVFDLSTGATNAQAGIDYIRAEDIGNGWWRCSIGATTASAGNISVLYRLSNSFQASFKSYTGDSTSGLYLWGAQCEEQNVVSSYIVSSGGAANRAADSLSITGANFSGFYNALEGTIITDVTLNSDKQVSIVSIDDGGVDDSMYIYRNGHATDVTYTVTDTSVAQVSIDGTTSGDNSENKIAFAYKANNFNLVVNGTASSKDESGTVPTVNQLQVGTLVPGNFHISTLEYFNTRLEDSILEAKTS